MKIYLPSDSKQSLGGGWTFRRNLEKGMFIIGHKITDDLSEADIALVAGVTMITRDTWRKLKEAKCKTVVRIDNVPRNSRNRNTGISRLRDFAQEADEVVYQCEWSRFYLSDFLGREGKIVYNGVDTDIFNTEGARTNFGKYENM